MKNVTITEIRNSLKAKGATLTKLKMRLNGNDAYKVEYSNGDEETYTVHGLKEAHKNGTL